jgi:DoxX-like family
MGLRVFAVAAVVAAVLAAALLMSAGAKLARRANVMTGMAAVGVPADRVWMLAVLEIAGAAGLVAGLFWWPIGVAAAIGVVLYFVGAVLAHLRKRDPGFVPPSVILVVAVGTLVLRLATV